jgi:hypothetical protein
MHLNFTRPEVDQEVGMLRRKQALFIVLASLAALSVTAATLSLPGRGEITSAQPAAPAMQELKTDGVGPAPAVATPGPLAPAGATPTTAPDSVAPLAADAPRQNDKFRVGLDWTFGGKRQRGW